MIKKINGRLNLMLFLGKYNSNKGMSRTEIKTESISNRNKKGAMPLQLFYCAQ
jgi:hypothetical protein